MTFDTLASRPNLRGKKIRLSGRKDVKTYGSLANSTIEALGGNDILDVLTLDGSTIILGNGNDQLIVNDFGNKASLLDGGAGTDTLNLPQINQRDVIWTWDSSANAWLLKSATAPEALRATLKNFETVVFKDGVQATLKDKIVTFQGTAKNDTILAYSDEYTPIAVNAGGGDDIIHFTGNVGTFVRVFDGGSGSDTLQLNGTADSYQFVRYKGDAGWFMQVALGNALFPIWVNVAELKGIENVSFAGNAAIAITGTELTRPQAQTVVSQKGIDNQINAPAGSCTFDLRPGLSDTISFLSSNYEFGTTSVTVRGYRSGDSVAYVDLLGATLISDKTEFNQSGIAVGTQILNWHNNAQLIVNYTA